MPSDYQSFVLVEYIPITHYFTFPLFKKIDYFRIVVIKNYFLKFEIKTLFLCLSFMVSLVGCVGAGGLAQQDNVETLIASKANARWQALIEGRLETAYSYETPEYREVYKFSQYRRKVHGVGVWKKAQVKKVSCTENKCIASIEVYVTIVVGRGFENVNSSDQFEENWVQDAKSGDWFHVSDL